MRVENLRIEDRHFFYRDSDTNEEYVLMRNGKDEKGRQTFVAVNVVNSIPSNWRVDETALTQPNGYVWINNGKSLFGGERENKLLRLERR